MPRTKAARRSGNLPSEVNSFVGRRRELSELKLAMGSSRLVTLTGPGGVGKTRLALRVATDLERACRDGAWLIELSDLQDPTLVAKTVMTTLGIRDHSGRWPLSLLVDFLAGRDLLLVLDNCEHLLDACAIATDEILRRTTVRIIATSRQPLGTAGETVYPVSGLAIPETKELGDLAQVQQFGAVALFCERAKAATGSFVLTEANKSTVLDLCRRVDGLPLAIELAAVRTRSLSVEEIAARLRESFALLKGGGATAHRRQRTLEAAIDWSYELLTGQEQVLLRRLAVFVGILDLEAAEAICTGSGIQAEDIVDLISSLVEKSLLQREQVDGRARYRLHETMREYAMAQLRRASEFDSVRLAHLLWYRNLAARVEADSFGPKLLAWFERLDQNVGNVRGALQFSLDNPEHVNAGLGLAAAIFFWWQSRAPGEGSNTIQALLHCGRPDDDVRVRSLWVLGALALNLSDFELAESSLGEARTLAQRGNDTHAMAMVLVHQALLAILTGGDPAAFQLPLGEARGLAVATDDPIALAYVNLFAGIRSIGFGAPELETAVHNLEIAAALSRRCGDGYLLAQTICMIGICKLQLGAKADAEHAFKESLRLELRFDNRGFFAIVLPEVMASLAVAKANPKRAARLQGAGAAIQRQQGIRVHHPYLLNLVAATAARAKEMLGPNSYAAEFDAGGEMRYNEALIYAMEEKYQPARQEAPPLAGGTALSKREVEVGELVAEGLSNKEIASRLFLSDRTVESHVRHMLNKLGVNSRVQIASWFSGNEAEAAPTSLR